MMKVDHMNLNIVQIGAVGHYEYVLPTAVKYKMNLSAVAYPHPEDDRARAERDFARFGFSPRVYDDVREMLEEERPDVAVINTVMAENGRFAMLALSMGISVFCEKPVAMTLAGLSELENVYFEAKKCNPTLVFSAMFGIDYLSHFETAFRYVKSGALGEIRLANAQKSYRLGKREAFYSDREQYGGTIPWVAIHGIEWITRIGGLVPISVTALGSTACNGGNGSMEVTTLSLFSCEGGKMASVSADVMRPKTAPTHDDDRLRLVGEKGILEVRGRRCHVIDGEGERELALISSETELFEELCLEMQGRGKCRVTAEDVFLATRAALSARESEDTGKTIEVIT